MNFILGGRRGYSFGKSRCALKKPPSLKINHKVRNKEDSFKKKTKLKSTFLKNYKFCNLDCKFTKLKKPLKINYFSIEVWLKRIIASRFHRNKFDLFSTSNELIV